MFVRLESGSLINTFFIVKITPGYQDTKTRPVRVTLAGDTHTVNNYIDCTDNDLDNILRVIEKSVGLL